MVTEKGLIVDINGNRMIVDDVKTIDGVDYVILFSATDKIFRIAKEIMVGDKMKYDFLSIDESIKVANAIDKLGK